MSEEKEEKLVIVEEEGEEEEEQTTTTTKSSKKMEKELYTPIEYPPDTPIGEEKERYGEFTPSEFVRSSGEISLEIEVKEVDDIFKNCISHPDSSNELLLEVDLTPTSGLYKDHTHTFRLEFGRFYPYVPPKVKCLTKCYNPWISHEEEENGRICLDLINENLYEMKSTGGGGLNSILHGILSLFQKDTVQNNKDSSGTNIIFNETVFLEFQNNYDEFAKKASLCLSENAKKK